MQVDGTNARMHGLDSVRAIALLLGVALHASMSFLPGPQLWVVADQSRSTTLSVAFFVIHVMRMTVFFLIAGFFARLLLQRLGPARFMRDRLRRIALPLIVAWPIVLVSITAVLVAALPEGVTPPPRPAFSVRNIPLTHLWFLYLLLLFYLVALPVQALVSRLDAGARMRRTADYLIGLVVRPWGALVLALPVAAAFYAQPYWVMWFGVPTPDSSLIPNRAAVVTFGTAFLLGWLAQRNAQVLLPRWSRQWHWHLAIAAIATTYCLRTAGVEPLLMPTPQGMRKLQFAIAYAVALWGWTFALLGMGLRFLGDHSPARRYLADASYWIYLAHLPLVMALQLAVSRWALPWPVKYLLVVGAAMALLLASYHYLVRPTVIGATLNGRRHPRTAALPSIGGSIAMRIALLALLVPAALTAQPTAPAPLPLDSVVARHQRAVGAIAGMQTRRTSFRVSGIAPFEIPVVIEAMRPNLLRKVVTIQSANQITGYDGADAWRIDPFVPGGDRPGDLPAAERDDLLEEADFDGALYGTAAKGHRLQYVGPTVVTVGTRRLPVHALKLTFAGGRESVIHLDAVSYLEVKRVQTRPVMGRDTEIAIVSSDYREVGGVRMPHLIEILPQGVREPIRISLDRVEWNVRLDRAKFSRR